MGNHLKWAFDFEGLARLGLVFAGTGTATSRALVGDCVLGRGGVANGDLVPMREGKVLYVFV